jgi:acetamidase/formamidase
MRLHLPILILTAATLLAETHQWIPDQYYRTFSHTNPVGKRIKPGDVVITKTIDTAGQDFEGRVSGPSSNPLTGPFYVEGANEGDALVV